MQAMDFPNWLHSNAHTSDQVVVHMDLGTGRDFEVLQALLESQSLSLIDQFQVRWHYQAEVLLLCSACWICFLLMLCVLGLSASLVQSYNALPPTGTALLKKLFGMQNWHLVLLWEYIFALLGIQYTSL